MKKIRIGIVGYGNVGRGVEKAVNVSSDMELVSVFTRRSPEFLKIDTDSAKVCHIDDALDMKGSIDVMILCGGSATDLPDQGPQFASHFNIVDSFDTHAKIPEYMDKLGQAAKNNTAILSVGWDPGLFSMIRALGEAVLPNGSAYTFWGRGVSQGHSDAIRRVKGVRKGIQYTVPIEEAVQKIRSGQPPVLTTREKHLRECYVVAEDGADLGKIEQTIKEMPNYFSDYDTSVKFISEEEFINNHCDMPHGGNVIRSGKTGDNNNHVVEFSLKLDSNPEFTGSILAAYARAAYRLAEDGSFGAKTVLDVPLSYLSEKDRLSLIKDIL